MKVIDIINPASLYSFYVNPFRLQKLKYYMEENSDYTVNLIDFACDVSSLDYCNGNIAVVNTPAGCHDILTEICRRQYKTAIFLGEISSAGDIERLLNDIFSFVGKEIYSFFTFREQDVLDLVKLLDSGESLINVPNLCGISYNGYFFENARMNFTVIDGISSIKHFEDDVKIHFEKNGFQIFLEGLSAGCENNCTFCNLSASSLSGCVQEILVDTVSSISEVMKNTDRMKFIQFTDPNFFGGSVTRLERIICMSNKLKEKCTGLSIGVDTRLDTIIRSNESKSDARIRRHAWDSMCNAGLRYVFIGLESFSDKQSKRYSKGIDLSSFNDALKIVLDKKLYYTFGLILWDPLMNVEELRENLYRINKNDLLGKTASLLKEMRIYEKSPYLKKYKAIALLNEYHVSDYVFIDTNDIVYIDPYIAKIIPAVRSIYSLFNNSGYRHSDVALFEVLFSDVVPQVLKDIPKNVAQFEYNLIIWLLSEADNFISEDLVKNCICKSKIFIESTLDSLHSIDCKNLNCNEISVYYYYFNVFKRAEEKLPNNP